MQIKEIIVYGYNGQKRVITLNVGKVNIITGSSNTGKSELISIIEYCLGTDECPIAPGIIRKSVAWYGLLLQIDGGMLFIAKQNPSGSQKSSVNVYFEEGDNIESPAIISSPNTNNTALVSMLSKKLGISPNRFVPPEGQTRSPFEATIKHTHFFCFQHQTEIAQRRILFHNQGEPFIKQTIKDVLPYFLGAIQEDQLAREQELTRAKRELAVIKREIRESEALVGKGTTKALSLLEEAREVGLIHIEIVPVELDKIIDLLNIVVGWSPNTITIPGSQRIEDLRNEIQELRDQLNEKSDHIKAAEKYEREYSEFTSEANLQSGRLAAIGLISEHENNQQSFEICPLCNHNLEIPIPQVSQINQSLEDLRDSINITTRERPRVREYIERLQEERTKIRQSIREKFEIQTDILKEQEAALLFRDININRGRIVGRISIWLESNQSISSTSYLHEKLSRAQERVSTLETSIDPEQRQSRLDSIINRIGLQMTLWANNLQLEHSGNPVRFDTKSLDIIVDTPEEPIEFRRMGSGKNWVEYHLILFLALHKHFRQQNRPVPGFIFFDQPTQAFFESSTDEEIQGDLKLLSDDDRAIVTQMFDLIFDAQAEMGSNFQVIITDHANLQENPRFKSGIIEVWRRGNALIPSSWKVVDS